jgi:putative flippase GtrA
MAVMNSTFIKYVLVGILNTAIHWSAMGCCVYLLKVNQAASNFIGFSLAVTFSFFVNATWTFESKTSLKRYFLFVGFMGLLAYSFGWMGDKLSLQPLLTAAFFSAFSLVCGYLYSKFIIFSVKNT